MLHIRPAQPADVPLILAFIHDLAEYEKEPHAVKATEADLLRDGFGSQPYFQCLIAEWDGQPAGFAFYFFQYSTWEGRPALYLEDLFVRPQFRKKGIGKTLFIKLAQIAVEKQCTRFQWEVLDWNQPAIDFYESLGAKVMREWLNMRMTSEAIQTLAEQEGKA
ncbi:MAG: GNAT family N-acetyltransferase [Acidobacteriaceae bacterium]